MANPTPPSAQPTPARRKPGGTPLVVALTVAGAVGLVLFVAWTILMASAGGPDEPFWDALFVSPDGAQIAFLSSAGAHHAGILDVGGEDPPWAELRWRSQVGPWTSVALRPGDDALFGIERGRLVRVGPEDEVKPFLLDNPTTPSDESYDRGIEVFAWDSSGRYLAAIRTTPDSPRAEGFVWDTKTGRATVLSRQNARDLGWSPDGSKLFFSFDDDYTEAGVGHWLILTWPEGQGRRVRYPEGWRPVKAAFDARGQSLVGLFASQDNRRTLGQLDVESGTFERFPDAPQPFFRRNFDNSHDDRSFAVCARGRIYWQEKVSQDGGRVDVRRFDPRSGKEEVLFRMKRRDQPVSSDP